MPSVVFYGRTAEADDLWVDESDENSNLDPYGRETDPQPHMRKVEPEEEVVEEKQYNKDLIIGVLLIIIVILIIIIYVLFSWKRLTSR